MTKYVELKIKIKSLADEARTIRTEENKLKEGGFGCDPGYRRPAEKQERLYKYVNLHTHRVVNVRNEARHSQLAYGYLRGREYKQIEAKCHQEPYWSRVITLVLRFGYGIEKPDNKQLNEMKDKIWYWQKGQKPVENAAE